MRPTRRQWRIVRSRWTSAARWPQQDWWTSGAHPYASRFPRPRQQFREDLQASVNFVQAAFGYENVMFAFPYGSRRRGFADAGLAAAAKQTGVICGLTTECSLIESASDPFQWGRFNVFPWDSDATLAAKLNGWYMQRSVWHVPEPGHPQGTSKGVGVPQTRPSLEAHSVPPCRCAGAPNQGLNTVSIDYSETTPMDTEFSTESTYALLLRALPRHRGKSFAFFVAVVAAALLFNAFGPHRYRSEGKLLIRLGRENSALDPP